MLKITYTWLRQPGGNSQQVHASRAFWQAGHLIKRHNYGKEHQYDLCSRVS